MGVISWIAGRLGSRTPVPSVKSGKRVYMAGIPTRTNNGFPGGGSYSRSIDAEARYTLRGLRSHSRTLYQNNDYYKKFIRLVVKNVVGPAGFTFKNNAKNANGTPDTIVNQIIRDAFFAWGKRGVCDVTGKLSWTDCQRLFIQAVPGDGEVLVRLVRGFDNAHRFAIQFIEADHLDETYNTTLDNGNEIRMGVEFDKWDRPVAYHILVKHPGDYTYQRSGNRYERIPAADMVHAFVPERPRQSRGIPWGHTAMTRLNNLGGYEEAAIVSKRTSASKMGFLVPPAGDGGEYIGDETSNTGDIINEVEPGLLEQLPAGWDFKKFDPAEPGGDFDPFMKRTLRGIAAGLDVSYHKLASDLEGVNYSSARAGELDDRDTWNTLQAWMAESFLDIVFAAWLDVQLLAGALVFPSGSPLPYAKLDKFCAPTWRSRSWTWVDPLKDLLASEKELANRLTSRTRLAAECGDDLEEIFAEIAAERVLAKKYGIDLVDPMPAGSTVKMPTEPQPGKPDQTEQQPPAADDTAAAVEE